MAKEPGYVCLFRSIGTDLYKIVATGNPNRRGNELNQKNPHHQFKCISYKYSNDMYSDRTKLKKHFSSYENDENWFNFPPDFMPEVEGYFDSKEIEQETEYYKNSSSISDDSEIVIIGVALLVLLGVGASISNNKIFDFRRTFNAKEATPEEIQLRKKYVICTDGIVSNDKHLVCNPIVNAYQSKFK